MVDFTIDLAHRAGALLLAATERERSFTPKQHADLVTDADRASEDLIVAALRERFPTHAILAEEGGDHPGDSGYTWVIDPLDGTMNYFHGLPIWSVSIGLLHEGAPLLGVVYDPARGELFSAERGRGAFLNGRRLHVSRTPRLAESLLTTGFPYSRFSRPDNNLREFSHLLMKTRDIRRPGSAALDLCATAAGRCDGHWELALSLWDVAAGALIVAEAGGTVTDWQGAPWLPWQGRIVATNGHIHAELIGELANAASA